MGKFQKNQTNKKQRKRIISWVVAFAVVCLLAAMPMLAKSNGGDSGDQASILSASVGFQNVDTQIIGGGQLASEASIRIKLPEEVKITEYLVGNGDIVSEGDTIATVDKVSVMTAITGVQETLDYLSKEITSAGSQETSTTVKALAGGTVKIIYGKKGEAVQDVLLDHGALAVLSLDDTMAVKLEVSTNLRPGDGVCVAFTSGKEVDGRVKSNQDGTLIVTMEDEDYAVGAQVTVKTEDGQRLGTGELYIFNPWNATAYSGTISGISVSEGTTVSVNQTLFTISDPGNSAEYQRLIDQRHEYEELMQELFQMYRTETITAPCDGIVTGVDKNGAFLLADTGESWVARLLSFFTGDTQEGFVAYTAKVVSVSDNGMELLMNPHEVSVSDLADISHISADISGMTESWGYTGDQTVYIQTSDGLLQAAGTAKVGDILLAVGDADTVQWFVVLNGGSQEGVVRTDNATSSLTAHLLSDVDVLDDADTDDDTGNEPLDEEPPAQLEPDNSTPPAPTVVCSGDDSCVAGSHNDGCPKIAGITPASIDLDDEEVDDAALSPSPLDDDNPCTGKADCTADTHNPGCLTLCSGAADCTAQNHRDGCLSQQTDPPPTSTASITTTALNPGVVGQSYTSPLQASDGETVLTGTWAASGLPGGLTIDPASGTISGTPTAAGSYTVTVSFTYNDTPVVKDFPLVITEAAAQTVYRGYVAQVVEIVDGAAKVKQSAYSYIITDLNSLPTVSADTSAMTVEKTYTSDRISAAGIAAEDIVLIVVDEDGTLVQITKANATPGGGTMPGAGAGGVPSGGMSAGGGMSGMAGGMGQQAQTYELYSLDKLTIASVTSQEHMTLDITVDELDITKIYIGQAATITMDALAGESFSATVSQISNSGTNEGGNSKFTVELTLEKSGDMLPGMSASASVGLSTVENALCVPVAALAEENGETVLYTSYDKDSGLLGSPVTVTIGTADSEYVQILDGISAGDTIYYPYYDTLSGSAAPQSGAMPFG